MSVRRWILPAAMLAALAAPLGARAADPALQPGTYGQYNPGTKKVAVPGNQLVVVRGKGGRLAFSLNAVRGVDVDQGYVAGTLPSNGRTIVWTQRGGGADCKLTFTLTPAGVTVAQDRGFGDCGFGTGVVADGQYVRLSDGGPPGTAGSP